MRLALVALVIALAALTVAVAVASAAPSPSGAASTADSSAKHRCKHKKVKHHHKRKKRCRRKGTTGTTPTGEKPNKPDKPSQPNGPPSRLLATSLEISPTQLQLQLSRASVAAGTTIVEQYNSGSDPHNLILERQGAVAFSFPSLDPGGDQRQTMNLTRGTWTLYCSLLDHKALGMEATLTVN
jgi:plastocyanin